MTADDASAVALTPASTTAGGRLPALRACLERARMRSRVGAMLRGTVFSLVAALVLLCGLEVLALYFNMVAPTALFAALPGRPLLYLAFSGAVFAGALLLAIALAFLLTPDIATLARATDRALALQERLSTALEVDASLQPHVALGPVRSALLADAERHGAAIDPRQIVRLDLPRAIWAVPVLIAAAVLLQLVSPDALAVSRGPVAGAERDGTGLTGQQSAQAAGNLRRIAELLDKDAEERSDPYLRMIARTLERLSSDAVHPGIDRRVLTSALNQLLGHARQAYGQTSNPDRGATPRDVMQQLQAALDDIAGIQQARAAAAREPEDGAGNVVAAERGQAGRPTPPSERRAVGSRSSPGTATPDRQLAGWDDLLKGLDDYDPVDPRIEKERAFAEEQRRARAAAQSAGAAKDAGLGEGDRAGDGTRPLGNGGATASTELAPGVEMVLPDQTADNGRRIRIELPPEVVLSGVAPPTTGTGIEWQRTREQAIDRAAPGAEGRKVVGRYFMRSARGAGP